MKATTIINGKGCDNKELQDHISRLPLDCLITVMKLTSPKDACRSAAICTTFKSVANSDYVWESFLPADLSSILSHAEIDVQQLPAPKKELYLHLCHNWILLDGGMKSLKLDLLSGAKIIQLHKQYLSMRGPIETPTEIEGTILYKDLSPKKNYAAYALYTGPPHLRVLSSISQLVYDSSSVCWETKLGELNTGVGEDRAQSFFIYDRYSISLRNNLIFRGIEVRPVC